MEENTTPLAAIGRASRGSLALSAVLFFLASMAIPVGISHPGIGGLLWVLLIALGSYLTHRQRNNVLILLGVTLAAAILSQGLLPAERFFSVALGAIAAAATVGVAAGGYFQTAAGLPLLLPVEAIVAVGLAYAITGDWLTAATGAALLPAVLLMSLATKRKQGCTTAVCYAAGGLLLALCALGLAWFWINRGELSVESLRLLINGLKDKFTQIQLDSRDALLATYEELKAGGGDLSADALAQMDELMNELAAAMSPSMIRASLDQVFSLMPAILAASCAILAYVAQRLLNGCLLTGGMSEAVTLESESLTMSVPSAVIYLLSVAVFAFAKAGTLAAMVASNLALMLLPGFCLLEFRSIRARTAASPALRRSMVGLLLLAMCCSSVGIFYLLAAFGAAGRVLRPLRKLIEKKLSDDGDEP